MEMQQYATEALEGIATPRTKNQVTHSSHQVPVSYHPCRKDMCARGNHSRCPQVACQQGVLAACHAMVAQPEFDQLASVQAVLHGLVVWQLFDLSVLACVKELRVSAHAPHVGDASAELPGLK
jgi:hypothetical protein